jgi:hypothetical protein
MTSRSSRTSFISLKEQSGFGWDEVLKMPTAPDEVWKLYLEAHPNAKQFRKKTLPFYEELDEIFSGKCASGK